MRKTLTITFAIALLTAASANVNAQDSLKSRARLKAPAKSTINVKSAAKPAIRANSAPASSTNTNLPAGSLNAQYDDLLKKSWTQQGYKVINPVRLSTFWRNVQDSLRTERTKRTELQKQLKSQNADIQNLKAEVSTHQANLEKSTAAVNEVSLLGMAVDKSTYNTIMWGIVIVLAVALAIVIITAGKSVREARYRRQLFDELSAEYQTYKVKANDKEKKLARELQTERNKVEELLNKG